LLNQKILEVRPAAITYANSCKHTWIKIHSRLPQVKARAMVLKSLLTTLNQPLQHFPLSLRFRTLYAALKHMTSSPLTSGHPPLANMLVFMQADTPSTPTDDDPHVDACFINVRTLSHQESCKGHSAHLAHLYQTV
jgi:hypothetical protein